MKETEPSLESFKRVQVIVIEKSEFALAHYNCKITAENFDRHATQRARRRCAKVLYSRQEL